MSEIFDKSQMSETIDVPAGCFMDEKLSESNELKLKQYTSDLCQILLLFDPFIFLTSQNTVVLEVDWGGGNMTMTFKLKLN